MKEIVNRLANVIYWIGLLYAAFALLRGLSFGMRPSDLVMAMFFALLGCVIRYVLNGKKSWNPLR